MAQVMTQRHNDNRLKQYFRQEGITHEELAAALGYAHRVTVTNNLNREVPSNDFVGRVARVYPDALKYIDDNSD